MKNFALLQFINQKEKITPEIGNLIAEILLQPNIFSKKAAEKISLWYQTLSIEEKNILYTNQKFNKALSKKIFLQNQIKVSSLWLIDLFKTAKYELPEKYIKKMAEMFIFTSIRLPSQVEININFEKFFKTFIEGINNHPHLIDELKYFLENIKIPLFIPPDNGDLTNEKFLGLFSPENSALYFRGDLIDYPILPTLIHEIGHSADSEKINRLISKTSLASYYDEIRQEAKSVLIETKEFDTKQGDINPFEDLYFHIKNTIKNKYPSLKSDKIERTTAFWFKNEFIALSLLDKQQLIEALNIWHIAGIRFTDQIFQHIQYLKKQYTHPDDINNSFNPLLSEMRSFFHKQIQNPLFFTHRLTKNNHLFEPLSQNLLIELKNLAGFVETNENSSLFMLPDCNIEKTASNIIRISFDLKKYNPNFIANIQSFYKKRGIYLQKSNGYLITKEKDSIEQMCRLIQHFFEKINIKEDETGYHFQESRLTKTTKREFLCYLKKEKIPFSFLADGIFVSEKFPIPNQIKKFSKKGILIQTDYLTDSPITLSTRLQVFDINPKIFMDPQNNTTHLLIQPNEYPILTKIKNLLKTAKEIQQYYYHQKGGFLLNIEIPPTLLAKKNTIQSIKNMKNISRTKE